MIPRVRRYISEAARAAGVTVGEIAGKGPSGPRWPKSRATRIIAARRAVWQQLVDNGFSQRRIAEWFGRHPSTVCVQVVPRRSA